jgi:hypothetical protein
MANNSRLTRASGSPQLLTLEQEMTITSFPTTRNYSPRSRDTRRIILSYSPLTFLQSTAASPNGCDRFQEKLPTARSTFPSPSQSPAAQEK